GTADGDGAAGADVGAVDLRRGGQRPGDGPRLDGCGECRLRCATAQGAVRSSGVVMLGEGDEFAVECGQGAVRAVFAFAGAQPLLQRLPEAFYLSAGLRVIRGGGDRLAAERGQVGLEGRG